MRIVYFLTLCALFVSCGQKFSLQKRKYSKGFYIGATHKTAAAKKQNDTPAPPAAGPVTLELPFTELAKVFKQQPASDSTEKETAALNPAKLNFTKSLSEISNSHHSLAPIKATSKKLEEKEKQLDLNTKKGRAADLVYRMGLIGLALFGVSLLLCAAAAKPSVFSRLPMEALAMVGAVFLTLVVFTALMFICNCAQLFNLLFVILQAILNT